MLISYSKVDCFNSCKYKYKLQYVDKLRTYDDYDPASPLKLGTAIHKGIEVDVPTAIQEYYNSYPIINEKHIEEVIKLEYWIPKVKALLPPGGKHEVKIETNLFIGYIDYLYPLGDGTYGIIDFKYSNSIDRYLESKQLHVYKWYAERTLNIKISELKYIFIPKIQPREKKTESRNQFLKRILETLHEKHIEIKSIRFEQPKIETFLRESVDMIKCVDFTKNPTKLCDWCDYKDYCINGNDLNIIKEEINMLPSTSRRPIGQANYIKLFVFGAPFSGKTTLVDQAPTPLNLNSDGNIKYVTMPFLPIKDEVKTEGRQTKRTFAWEVFTNAIDELEKGSEFETIAVDLTEDMYDYCRVYMCDKNGWEHESDDSFKAYDIVRSEFLRNMKRLLNLPYNIVLISHEDTSRDIMSRDKKITRIAPNLAEKIANKLAGMVDLVARVVVNTDGTRKLEFKQSEVVFGGGRLQGVKATECELSWKALMEVYNDARKSNLPKTAHQQKVEDFKKANEEPKVEEVKAHAETTPVEVIQSTTRRTRTPRTETKDVTEISETEIVTPVEATVDPEHEVADEPTPVAPVRRTRRVRG